MKAILYSLALCLLGCGPVKSIFEAKLIEGCPKDGDCTIELLQNKSLEITTDDSGATRYKMVDAQNKTVIHFKYSRKVKGNIQDAGYREEILLELSGNDMKSELHSDLKNAKILFGRFCFCKGQTGYYRINKGNLTKNRNIVRIQFSTSETPQVVKEIAFSLQ